MSSDLLIHDKTHRSAKTYLDNPTQVLAIVGANGAGKSSLAMYLATELLQKPDLTNESRFISIKRDEDKKEITIETVRSLIKSLRLKQPGDAKRLVYIEEAGELSREAQNALLKTLEQPNTDTYFILTVSDTSQLLPTLFSRTQKIVAYPVNSAQAEKYFSGKYSTAEIKSAWLLSEGLAGHLSQLLEEEEQPLKAAVASAKDFLGANRYQRLASVDKLSKDKAELANLMSGLSRILKILHHANIKNDKASVTENIHKARLLVKNSQNALNANASAKAVMLRLILNLRV